MSARLFRPAVVLVILVGLALTLRAALPTLVLWVADPPSAVGADQASAITGQRSKELIARAFSGIETARLFDFHVHVAGTDPDPRRGCADATHTWTNPRRRTWWHPRLHASYLALRAGGGVQSDAHANREYVDRLRALATDWPTAAGPRPAVTPLGRFLMLPFAPRFSAAGTLDCARSDFVVTNEWAAANATPPLVAALSVHPYAPDARAQLERAAAHRRDVRVLKWLPSAMGIDPALERLDAFYACLRTLGIVLLSHAGEESAVDAPDEEQVFSDPRRLTRAVQAGVKVVVAHAASGGEGIDGAKPARLNFDLFLDLVRAHPDAPVYGELSATTLRGRDRVVLTTLLEDAALQRRLVNGSDYPLPAIGATMTPGQFEDWNLLERGDAEALEQIREWNPLVFDFVLKRSLRTKDAAGRDKGRFANEVFYLPAAFAAPATDRCER